MAGNARGSLICAAALAVRAIATAGEERERELRNHAREVARLNREVQDLREVDRKEQPRKRFLGIF